MMMIMMIMMMSVEQSVEFSVGEIEVFRENLLQCRFVHHKSHTTLPGLEAQPGVSGHYLQPVTIFSPSVKLSLNSCALVIIGRRPL
jgi:hypothetical protein